MADDDQHHYEYNHLFNKTPLRQQTTLQQATTSCYQIRRMTRIFLSLLSLLTVAHAFVGGPSSTSSSSRLMPSSSSSLTTRSSALSMAPRFDKKTQKWYPTKTEEEAAAGYPIVNTLLLHGPKPFFQRVLRPDDYDQAVLKFMAGDKCSRDVAQGNMDAYLDNPNDWAYNRLQAEKGAYQPDYVTLKTDALVLTLVWSAIVFTVAGRAGWALITGGDFWSFLP